MTKFILLDPSIKNRGGHYLEYAENVLESANAAGYAPCIATNKNFRENIPYTLYKTYKYDIWGMYDGRFRLIRPMYRIIRASMHFGKRVLQFLKDNKIYKRILYIKKIAQAKFIYSKSGYMLNLLRAKAFSTLIQSTNKPLFFLLLVISPLILPIIFILLVFRFFLRSIKKLVFLFMRYFNGKNLIKLENALVARRQSKNFYRSTKQTLKTFKASEGDIIFVPTISFSDLSGLASLINDSPQARKVSWHLVFRRNLFFGREVDYDKNIPDYRTMRQILLTMKGKKFAKVFFYTDTEKLSEQYNLIYLSPFHTLPIPTNKSLLETPEERNNVPLNIVYLGDARKEKGYDMLPDIVDTLWDDYVKLNKVKFDFQSNFAFSDMKANHEIVSAREELESVPPEYVNLRKEPLGTSEYLSLVKSGDIGLLFFDRENYYARSSNTFIECMQAAIPVVVSSGSWLANDISKSNYTYLNNLVETGVIINKYLGEALDWESVSISDGFSMTGINPMQNGVLSFSNASNASCVEIKAMPDNNVILVSYDTCSVNPLGSFVRTSISAIDVNGKTIESIVSDDMCSTAENKIVHVIFKIPHDASIIKITFCNAFDNRTLLIENIKIGFSDNDVRSIPYGYAGLCYSRKEDIPNLLMNIIDNYKEYKRASILYSKQWRELHNAAKLVSCLTENALK